MRYQTSQRGITLFFAILLIALMLGIGASISILAQKQIQFSTLGGQSEASFYAANAGIECAEYWDKNGTPNPFDQNKSSSASITCDNHNYHVPTGLTMIVPDPANGGGMIQFGNGSSATCALVTVTKYQNNGVWITDIVSQGYNTCNTSAPNRLERAIHVSY